MKTKNCPVCFSNYIQFKFVGSDILYCIIKKTFDIYECKNCNAMFLNPIPTVKETSTFYPKTYYSYKTNNTGGFFNKIKNNIIKYYLEPSNKFTFIDKLLINIFKNKFSGVPLYRKKNGTFLDIGCGSGSNLEILQKYGWKTSGIELDKKAVGYAKSKGLDVQLTSLEEASFGKRKFDCIRIWHVFEHLTNPHEAIKKISTILKDDGEVLIAVPNSDSFVQNIFKSYWYGLDVPRHVINYSPRTLAYFFSLYGFNIEKIQYASAGSYIGSISHILRKHFNYNGNLINNIFLVFLFAPLDFISDIFKKGDIIYLTVRKI